MSCVVKGSRFLLAPAKARSAAAAAAAASPESAKQKKASLTGIKKPQRVSPSLASFLGVPEASRADAVKHIWAHIKTHNLQNPENKKEINCDSKLKMLFDGRDKVHFLEIAKYLGPHFVKTQ